MTAAIALIARFWPYLIGAALLAGGWRWHSGQVSTAHAAAFAQGQAQVQCAWDAADAAQAAADAQATRAHLTKKEAQHEAVSTAQTRRASASQRDQAAVDRLAGERDGLRRDLAAALDTIRRCGDLPAAAAPASADRSAAIADLLEDLERAGAEVSRAADGHAADALMYQQAWPR